MKSKRGPVFFRYEFSDESGRPEGGDIFELANFKKVQEMTAEILKVAYSDNVSVNLTIGEEKPFIGFLKKVGMTQKDIKAEMVCGEDHDHNDHAPAKKKATKAKTQAKAKSKKI